MASPQLEDGYAQVALELLAALAAADFPKFEKMLLSLLVAAQYGPEKRPGEYLDPVQLAALAGCHPSSFRKAIKGLVAAGAIAPRANGSYALVKDWERWLGSRSADRIDDGGRAFIAYLTDRFGSRNKPTHKRKPGATRPHGDRSDKHVRGATRTQNRGSVGAIEPQDTCSNGAGWPHKDSDGSSANPATATPLEEYSVVSTTPYILEIKREEELREHPDPDAGVGAFLQDEDEGCLASAPKTVEELIAWLPCIGADDKAIRRLARKVPAWVDRIRARCPRHAGAAIDWVQDALIKGCDKDDLVSYAEEVLSGYVAEGGRRKVELAPPPEPIPSSRPSPDGPRLAAARPTKGQLLDAEIARQREAMRQNRIREEAARG